VRHDIIEQLALREPHKYIASFHRANLRYVVRQCDSGTQSELLVRALRSYSGSNVIIYSPTIARVEETVAFLAAEGIRAIGYHGKMDGATRRRNQEKWMSDEVPVLVGTVAFGLGINKAAVRAVIHLSLPKSIEQYYQEAGRAGRDGLPADCVLLWQKRDAGLLAHFIEQLSDSKEHERAWQRYHIIRAFVDSARCRHRQICLHFGETPKWSSCGACDVCGYDIEWLRAPVAAPRSKRRAKRSATERAAAAAATASITFTRGPRPDSGQENELPASASAAAASTPTSGWWGSSGRRENSGASGSLAPGVDPGLREYLREWRRVASKKLNIAAFIIMHDTSLDHLCQVRPRSLAELRKVSGFGERKTEMYGLDILEALERFRNGERIVAESSGD
jgi:superfamily II DNA helicase RecQ